MKKKQELLDRAQANVDQAAAATVDAGSKGTTATVSTFVTVVGQP